jgi:hypothetical protein
MSLLDRFLGLISAPAYALQRSRLGLVRLHIAALLLGLLGAAYVVYLAVRFAKTKSGALSSRSCMLRAPQPACCGVRCCCGSIGLHLRPAIRVRFEVKKGYEALYLSSDDPELLARLLSELRSKALAARA